MGNKVYYAERCFHPKSLVSRDCGDRHASTCNFWYTAYRTERVWTAHCIGAYLTHGTLVWSQLGPQKSCEGMLWVRHGVNTRGLKLYDCTNLAGQVIL